MEPKGSLLHSLAPAILSWDTAVPSMLLIHFWRSILILLSRLRLGFPSGFLHLGHPTKILYEPLLSPIRATRSTHLISLFDHPNNIWRGIQSKKFLVM
jgi:hypothetical protein